MGGLGALGEAPAMGDALQDPAYSSWVPHRHVDSMNLERVGTVNWQVRHALQRLTVRRK